MAGRVCLALGIDDPIKWLADAPQHVVHFWDAFFQVEPFGCEWERSAMQASMLSALTATVAASAGVKNPKVYQIRDFMPQSWVGNRKSSTVNMQSIKKFQAYASRYTQK